METKVYGWWRAPAFIVLCGCLIALITYGLRTSFGLFATPITEGHGWSPEVFALAIAIQNIVWGMDSPSPARSPTATARRGCSLWEALSTPWAWRSWL